MKLNVNKLEVGQVVYICGLNVHKGGRINLNKKPFKDVVKRATGHVYLENHDLDLRYPGYELYDNLEECQLAYTNMCRKFVLFCCNQIDRFNDVIDKLENYEV